MHGTDRHWAGEASSLHLNKAQRALRFRAPWQREPRQARFNSGLDQQPAQSVRSFLDSHMHPLDMLLYSLHQRRAVAEATIQNKIKGPCCWTQQFAPSCPLVHQQIPSERRQCEGERRLSSNLNSRAEEPNVKQTREAGTIKLAVIRL